MLHVVTVGIVRMTRVGLLSQSLDTQNETVLCNKSQVFKAGASNVEKWTWRENF